MELNTILHIGNSCAKWHRFSYIMVVLFLNFSLIAQNGEDHYNITKLDSLKELIPTSSDSVRFKILNKIFVIYANSKLDSAQLYVNKQHDLVGKLDSPQMRTDAFLNKGSYYAYKGVLDSSYFWFKKSLDSSVKYKYKRGKILALTKLSSVFNEMGEMEKQLEYSQEAYNLSKKDTISIINSSINLGIAFLEVKEFAKSKAILSNALKLSSSYYNYGRHGIMLSLGHLYEKQKKLDSAALYYHKALKNVNGSILNKGIDLFNLGNIMYANNKSNSAEYYWITALPCFESIGHPLYQISIYNQLGELMLDRKKYRDALYYLKKGLEINKEQNAPELLLDLLNNLHMVYAKLKNYDKSYEYLVECHTISDLVVSKKQKTEIKNEQLLTEIAQVEERYLVLNEQQLRSQKKSDIYLVVLVFLILILIPVLSNSITTHRNNKALFNKIQQLTKQAIIDNNTIVLKEKRIKSLNALNEAVKNPIKQSLATWIELDKYLKPITIYKLADRFNTNQKYLAAVIREEYNQNYSDFLNCLRINYALKQMETNLVFRKYSMESISKLLGYKSRNTFYTTFKEYTGITPFYYIKRLESLKIA